jgi:hypothetical protein
MIFAQVAAHRSGEHPERYTLIHVFPANQYIFEVEPRGFEPLTSAVQSQHDSFPEVSRACKIPANSCILCSTVFSRFQDIHSGCCTVAAQVNQ